MWQRKQIEPKNGYKGGKNNRFKTFKILFFLKFPAIFCADLTIYSNIRVQSPHLYENLQLCLVRNIIYIIFYFYEYVI